jgi:hypothetical protein
MPIQPTPGSGTETPRPTQPPTVLASQAVSAAIIAQALQTAPVPIISFVTPTEAVAHVGQPLTTALPLAALSVQSCTQTVFAALGTLLIFTVII